MAEIKSMLLGVLVFGALIVGFTTTFNEWFANTHPATNANTDFLGVTNASRYINNWANTTQDQLQNNELSQVPIVGGALGTTETTITVIYSVVTLILDIPAQVVGPMLTGIATALLLPTWFVAFVLAAILLLIIIAIVNALKGGTL